MFVGYERQRRPLFEPRRGDNVSGTVSRVIYRSYGVQERDVSVFVVYKHAVPMERSRNFSIY